MKTEKQAIIFSSTQENNLQKELFDHFKNAPLPEDELLANLGLFLTSKNLSRLLFFCELYKKIIRQHGIIVEFGTRWGQLLTLMSVLRGIYEPFNRQRKVVGFDTFEGHKGLSVEDGPRSESADGGYGVSAGYEQYLDRLLYLHEQLNPAAHIKKYEVIKGDATQTVPAYLERHPETIVALAVFDFDIYKPTKTALDCIRPRLTKGSILVFDELCDELFPGETVALQETFGLNNVRLKRLPFAARLSYLEIE